MFQFRRFPSYAYLIQRRMTEYCSAGFPHSEIHGYNGYLLLPVAYRSLSRPSSAPDAKAFPLRSFQLDLLVAKSAWLRFRFRENFARSPAPRFSPKTGFRRGGTGYEFCSELSENSWFSLRIMQAYKDRNCMSPCILSDAVPQSICFVMCLHTTPLCCLTCFCHIVQFSRCRSPTAFAVRFEDPIFQSGLQIQRQIAWWARVGSNHRPYDYQSYALAS